MHQNKYKNPGYLILLLSVLLAGTGCSRMQRMETNIDDTNKKVQALQQQMTAVLKAIDDVNVNTGGATSKMKADLTMLIKQLDDQLERLKAELDESQHRFKQLEKKIDVLSNQRLLIKGVPSDSGDTTVAGQSKVVQGLDLEKLYNQAREDYISGKYDVAFKGFETVLQKDNSGTYKDNALYWMGESFYKQKKYKEAKEYYSRCVNEFPQGNKICSAYFKLGLVGEKLKKKSDRDNAWNTLIEKCEGSNEAFRAKELMK